MEIGETLQPTDNNQKIEETIPIPLGTGEFFHVSTSKKQLGDFFEEYVSSLPFGLFNGQEARKYFDENVDFTFQQFKSGSRGSSGTKIEQKILNF